METVIVNADPDHAGRLVLSKNGHDKRPEAAQPRHRGPSGPFEEALLGRAGVARENVLS